MQWKKYADLIGSDPMLDRMLAEHVGPRAERLSGRVPESTLVEWVEQKLKYVAVRPWQSIEMTATDVHRDMDLPGRKAFAKYVVYYHIQNGDPHRCCRARYLSWEQDTISVGDAMMAATEWHKEYWAKQDDCPLVFDAVLRKSELWQKKTRWTEELLEEAVSIWRVPEGFQLQAA